MNTLTNVKPNLDEIKSNSIDIAVNATPISDENGVSTNYESSKINLKNNSSNEVHWYAMRTTYGREKKAYDYIVSNGGTAFYPTRIVTKIKNGKKVNKEISQIPNIFFVQGTEEVVKGFAFDNVHLPFLRFYYGHKHEGINILKYPLIVPDSQIDSLKILCKSQFSDTLLVPESVKNFVAGELVRVIEGDFKGIIGRVSRWHGQQRVAVIIDGLCTMATAYIPTSFLEKL